MGFLDEVVDRGISTINAIGARGSSPIARALRDAGHKDGWTSLSGQSALAMYVKPDVGKCEWWKPSRSSQSCLGCIVGELSRITANDSDRHLEIPMFTRLKQENARLF